MLRDCGDMLYDIVQSGDPVLRRPARLVGPGEIPTPFIQDLISSMIATMRKALGVGLAAPQVGEALQIFVMEDTQDFIASYAEARLRQLDRRPFPVQVVINPT